MAIFSKIKSVLFEPTKFFTNLKKEKGFKDAFTYFLVLSFVSTVLGIITQIAFQKYYIGFVKSMYSWAYPIPQQTTASIVLSMSIWFIFGLFLSFIIAGILHVWILIFGGKEDYSKTYQLSVYSRTPSLVFAWIPFIAILAWIYNLFLLILGTQKVHGISRNRAILMYVIPLILFAILMIIFMAVVLYVIGMNPEIFMNYTAMQ